MHRYFQWGKQAEVIMHRYLFILISFLLIINISCPGQNQSSSEENNNSNNGGSETISGPTGTSDGALITRSNFEYLGAFRLPLDGNNGTSFGYGGWGMAYRPDMNSLFVVSHDYQQMVAEVTIPEPLDHRDVGVSGLNVAEYIQNFTDVTNGRAEALDLGNGFRVNGLAYLDSKLYWTARPYYNVSPESEDPLSHGVANADFSSLNSQGMWRLEDFHSSMTAGYIFTIPAYFADEFLEGKYLASGLFTAQGIRASSAGPAIFAYAPWQDDPSDGIPSDGTTLDVVPLLYYPCNPNGFGCDSTLTDYKDTDGFQSAVWVYTEDRHAVFVAGGRATTNRYGLGQPGDCNDYYGYHGEPYNPTILLYDPEDLAQVATGEKEAIDLQPYEEWNPREYLVETCEWEFNGMGYDQENQLLYLLHRQADTEGSEPQPIIYVFQINDNS